MQANKTRQPTPFDTEYTKRLGAAINTGLPRDFDIWLNTSLDDRFFPLCQELVSQTSTLGKVEVAKARADLRRKPKEFPHFFLESGFYYGLVTFIQHYDGSKSRDENVAFFETMNESARRELAEFNAQSPDLSDREVRYAFSEITQRCWGSSECISDYDSIRDSFGDQIPTDPEEKERYLHAALSHIGATKLRAEFPLSDRAKSTISVSPNIFYDDPDYSGHFLQRQFILPQWLTDKTITEDLLYAASIMVDRTASLKGTSRQLVEDAPVFLANEILRAKDASLGMAPIMVLNEGIVSILQALNLGIGQVTREHKIEEEVVVERLIEDRIPTQTARYLPLGFLGPTTIKGHYIKGLWKLEDGQFVIDSGYRRTGAKIKQQNRDTRSSTVNTTTLERYLKRISGPSVTILSGGICPVSRDHNGKADSEKYSGIDVLSDEFLRILKLVREVRAETGAA